MSLLIPFCIFHADVQGSDNRIPLSLQWLLPKPAENKPAVGTGTQETSRRCMARRKRMFFVLPCLIWRPIVVIIGVMKKETPILLCAKIAGEMEIKSLADLYLPRRSNSSQGRERGESPHHQTPTPNKQVLFQKKRSESGPLRYGRTKVLDVYWMTDMQSRQLSNWFGQVPSLTLEETYIKRRISWSELNRFFTTKESPAWQ
ncbi:GYF DOMAIN-CONTAINING PROTEIN [Salix viminalis]|uniref:GYF DOMAIN-CONTAINING PROTEIN n=1 Tax=Salix viminalis TaxID=40686 RepID=A0A9Q0SEE3_SALVM|nr:GYF DOMAIN-CONTAINING PROTEIN [Salix viminalis]